MLFSTLACSPPKTIEEQLTEAQQLIQQKNNTHAIIALKNILKDAPKTASARFVLSRLYFNTGNTDGAEKELKRAIEHGLDTHKYGLTLAEMYIEMNDSQAAIDLLDDMTLTLDGENIIKNILKGRAYLNLENVEQAKEAFELANDINDDAPYSLYGSAILASMGAEHGKAAELLDKSIEIKSDIAEIWLLRARIAEANKNYEKSISAYQRFMKLRPKAHSIELLIAENHIKLGQLDQADKVVEGVLTFNKNHPTSNLLKARIAGQRKDFAAVKQYSEIALTTLPLNPLALYLSGVANFYLNNYEQSYSKLMKVVGQLPKDHQAHKLLMVNLVKLGYFEQLDQVMSNYSGFDVDDIELLADMGDKLFYQGSVDAATNVFSKIVALKATANNEKTKLAVLKLLNKNPAGLADLEEITSGEENNRNASLALALTYFKKQEFSRAINSLDGWLAQNSDDIEALLFKAKILDAQGNEDASLVALQLAQSKSDSNPDTLFMIAQNRFKDGDFSAAQNNLYQLIEVSPQYKKAYTLLLRIKREINEEEKFFQLMTTLIQKGQDASIWPRIILAQNALLTNKYSEAENFLTVLSNKELPSAFYSTMMDVYFGLDNRVKVNEYAELWKISFPNTVLPYLKHIALAEKGGNIERALELTKLSLTETSLKNNLQLMVLSADYLLRLEKMGEAESIINRLSLIAPKNSIIQLLSGQFSLIKGNLSKAVSQLYSSYQQRKNNRSLLLLVDAYRKSGQTTKAIELIENTDEIILKQVSVQTILAEIYVKHDPVKAISVYKALVKSSPNNVLLLNNLAWMLIQEKEFVDAVKYAKLAEQLMPNYGAILDTLGVALMGNEENKAALLVLTKASKQSDDTSIKVHLAIAMHKNNQPEKSLSLLEQLTEDQKAAFKHELAAIGL